MLKHVVHLTSVHPRYDTRIFLKQCRSLVKAGYSVSLVVADGMGDEIKDDVNIVDVGVSSGRLDRMLIVSRRVFDKAKQLDADIYHFHDPELLPFGIKLKRLGKKVIFDAHEDVPKQLLSKPYLNKPTKWALSKVIGVYEAWACKQFDVIVTATPFIRDKFLAINPKTVDINNFPILGELVASTTNDWGQKRSEVCYVGGITVIRGIKEVVKAMEHTQGVRLNLVGKFSERVTEKEVKRYPSWSKVNELGFLGRKEVSDVLSSSMVGIVTFLPAPNHIDSQPNKMFEYMSAGIPIVTSSFPLWKEIVEGNQCGICVDPFDSKAIAEALMYLTTHPEEAEQMGDNGRSAVEQKYNWGKEEKKLLNLYKELVN